MQRLDRIREILTALDPSPHGTESSAFHPHISHSVLVEIVDCLYYIFFPECTNPPSKVTPMYAESGAVMEWVISHVAGLLTTQIYFAFVLHGDANAVADVSVFKPLDTSQRTQLDWNAPQSRVVTSVPVDGNGKAMIGIPGEGKSGSTQPSITSPDILPETLSQTREAHSSPLPVASFSGSYNGQHQFLCRCRTKADAIVTKFLVERLAHVRWLLHTDVEAIFKGDVAATSPSEVVLCYPGLRCMLHQRVAHQLYLLGVPTNFTRMLTEMAHSATGIDIHPNTAIGHHFFIDHGTGVVIGATAIIGNYVSIYQGVTLGARSFPTDKKTGEKIRDLPRHPIIEDGVTIYANAVVLGRITIGERSTIGGNCWIVRSVPPHSSIVQKSNHVLLPHEKMFLEKDGSGI